ncbi:MAG: glycosyltransferase [Dokdonella sp.]|uniref:glycosyltransferase n=1 Tax=Dokdonella sp. TaxID=2291710 RepID=UPI003266017A
MLRVNLISWDNGVGLSRDLDLLAEALAAGGAHVHFTRRGRGTWRKLGRPLKVFAQTAWQAIRHRGRARFDLNIMLEHVFPEYLRWARATAFIPNPEWCTPSDVAALDRVALVLAKTHAAERLFAAHSTASAYIGFTSPDRLDRDVARQRTFFHLAGRSGNKGTEPLLALWRAHPEWPTLTVVQSPRTAKPGAAAANIRHRVDYVADGELRALQNAHRFHLCPSETEGFGHYLVEAMSVGAVALTLDAAPMNELVQPDRGILVPASRTGTQNLATTHFFDERAMSAAIEQMIGMSADEVDLRGCAARAWYETNSAAFPQRLLDTVRRFET